MKKGFRVCRPKAFIVTALGGGGCRAASGFEAQGLGFAG